MGQAVILISTVFCVNISVRGGQEKQAAPMQQTIYNFIC